MKGYALIVITLIFVLSGCSCKSKERELARQKGIEAATNLINTGKDNQMALQNSILEDKAIQSEYIISGDTVTATEFENAYMEHIKAHDPILAEEMF